MEIYIICKINEDGTRSLLYHDKYYDNLISANRALSQLKRVRKNLEIVEFTSDKIFLK